MMIEPEWEQDPPDDEIERLWQTEVFSPVDMSSPALDELLARLRTCFGGNRNRGVEFAAFSFPNEWPLSWYISRSYFDEIGFGEALLSSEAFRTVLPDITPPKVSSIDWERLWSYSFDGELATLLMFGGAYVQFEGTGKQAKDLAMRACESLFGERYEEVFIFKTRQAWSDWFYRIVWDYTFIGVDKREMKVWVLCLTDTD